MQLFSLGLWVLHEDGTSVLDAAGSPIPSYTNDDIVSQAKLWTGFTGRDLRGNMEMKRISVGNQVDPSKVLPIRRDFTPKMNLYQGHIGDAYPLCNDLPPRTFLEQFLEPSLFELYTTLGVSKSGTCLHNGGTVNGAPARCYEAMRHVWKSMEQLETVGARRARARTGLPEPPPPRSRASGGGESQRLPRPPVEL